MGFFKKSFSGSDHSGSLNAFLGAGTEYRGRLDFVGTVRIDGAFHGEIVSDGSLVLGREAVVHGQISVGTIFSNGSVVGDVVASQKAVLQKHSTLEGSLCAPALVIEEGAALEGNVDMSPTTSIGVSSPTAAIEHNEQVDESASEEAEAAAL